MEYNEGRLIIHREERGRITILKLAGKLVQDNPNSESNNQLKQLVQQLIEDKRIQVIINFSEVTWVSDIGLGELVRSFTALKRAGGDLRLCGLSQRTIDLLTITKLVTLFKIFKNEPEAIRSFEKIMTASIEEAA